MNITDAHESNWPALDRTAYLIEHACVPKAVPTYCAEEGQLFAALAAALHQRSEQEKDSR